MSINIRDLICTHLPEVATFGKGRAVDDVYHKFPGGKPHLADENKTNTHMKCKKAIIVLEPHGTDE